MKKSPIMLIATFGVFLGLQAYSACQCGEKPKGSCCHSKSVTAQGHDIKGPCCDRCTFRSSGNFVVREDTVNAATAAPILASQFYDAVPVNDSVFGLAPSRISHVLSITHVTSQPRAPPAA